MKTLITFSILFATSILYAETNVQDIMEKAHFNSYYQGKDGKAQVLMKVYQKNNKKPIKKMFYLLRYDITDGGEQMFLTYFTAPSDLKRTTFLVHKKMEADDFRRLYIPASDKVLAIAGSRKQDPFMGSDFSYEDVSGRHFSKDEHKLLKEEKYNGVNSFVIESIPKKKDKFLKITSWISKKDFIPLKVEYYNQDRKVYRIYTSDIVKTIQGFKTIMKRTMKSPLDGTYTVMLFNSKKIKYNIGLTEKVFSERSLKNPPMKFLK